MSGSLVLDASTVAGDDAQLMPVSRRATKDLRSPADPLTVEELVVVMRMAGDGLHGRWLRGLIVVLWRAGLRIDEALALRGADLESPPRLIFVRHGKGGRRREIGIDDRGWQEL
jgi:integrase